MCAYSAESGGAVTHTEQEKYAHVGCHKDCNPAELQDGRRSLGCWDPGL